MLQSETERINDILCGSYGYLRLLRHGDGRGFHPALRCPPRLVDRTCPAADDHRRRAFCMDIFIDNRTIAYQEAIATAQPALPGR